MADPKHCQENAFDVTRQERFQDVTAKFMSVFEAQAKIKCKNSLVFLGRKQFLVWNCNEISPSTRKNTETQESPNSKRSLWNLSLLCS